MKLNFTFLKHCRYSLVLILFFTVCASAQCPSGDLVIEDQQDLDNYAAQYPNCTNLPGYLIVDSATVTDLSPLANITSVAGSIIISGNPNLTSLAGLNVITAFSVLISANASLTSLHGLENLTGDLHTLSISGSSLNDIQALSNIHSVLEFQLYETKLTSLNGLSGLASVRNFTIYGNSLLPNCIGLSNVASIETLTIQNNNSLVSLAGLESLNTITDNLTIKYNSQIASLNGIQNVDFENLQSLEIYQNPNLSVCSQPTLCGYLSTFKIRHIDGNSGNCYDEAAVIASCTPAVPTTKLRADLCGAIVASSATAVYADALQGAAQYRFRITDGVTQQTIDKPSSAKYFRFNELSQYKYNTSYTVDVSAYVDGSWSPYGDACTVITPATQIKPNQCGSAVATLSTGIYATALPGAIMYRFRITTPNTEFTIDKATPTFKIADVPLYQYATTYTVDVAVSTTNGIFSQYGPSCFLTSPAMPAPVVKASHCGSEVALVSYIYADAVPLATAYRFRVNSIYGNEVVEKTVRYFKLIELSMFGYNIEYQVEVSAFVNGNWSAYGPACTVHTPLNVPVTRLKDSYCNRTYATFSPSLFAYAVPGATLYSFRVTNGAEVQIVANNANWFKMNMLTSYQYYTTYTIEVAVMIGGAWSNYGAACNINVIPKYVAARDTATEDEATGSSTSLTAYPNPSFTSFVLDIITEDKGMVNIQVFDLTGKLLDAMEASPEELSSKTFGDRYSAGIYNVIVTQGDYQKSMKLVKK